MPTPRVSAGLLLYRAAPAGLQVLLVHPGGPFFRNKDEGAWSIPKGEVAPGEDNFLATARREFKEELGIRPVGHFLPLTPVKQKGGKTVHAWAFEGDCDVTRVKSNTFSMEWPPRSGRRVEFPEIDRAEFFDVDTARRKINPAQAALVEELVHLLRDNSGP
jgi:predicted NUDIX family NTP pyrophosphohydrolase